jgi:hypothetical protein
VLVILFPWGGVGLSPWDRTNTQVTLTVRLISLSHTHSMAANTEDTVKEDGADTPPFTWVFVRLLGEWSRAMRPTRQLIGLRRSGRLVLVIQAVRSSSTL